MKPESHKPKIARRLIITAVVAWSVSGYGVAQTMYKCTEPDGTKLSFKSVCPEGQIGTKMLPPPIPKPIPDPGIEFRKAIANQIAKNQAEFDEMAEDAIRQRKVLVGMNESQVVRAWGQPSVVNASVSASGKTEQWVYRNDGGGNYLYLDNGRLRSIQVSR